METLPEVIIMKQWIKIVGTGRLGSRHLTYDEAVAAAHAIARGESTDAQTAAFLMAMRMKGEADDEMMGFIDVFRKYSLPYRSFSHSLNCAGPYDGRLYFPVTIPVSLLLASVGFPQVLHGSESLPPKLGQSLKELLEGLGVRVELEAKEWEKNFLALGIGFIWTDLICPPFGRVRHVREQVGLRTFLNTVEKVINPVHSLNMVIGVNHKTAMDHLIHLLPKSGFETAYIVQGVEGSEDLPTYKNSSIRKVTPWGDESSTIDPATFGFSGEPLEKCTKERQLELLRRIIAGDDSADIRNEREHVIFNTGLRLYWFDKVASYEEGFGLARSLLQRKEAQKLLGKWQELSSRSAFPSRLQANG
ncbi:anthranilate phosphoribosyltransferase [Paenibacillus caseinilyticus]|uniref:Anthranilate phosphoribosyltransferase n=1 Tax=Paenibacillus mucilaginosus K02 TaxID=997761 RepID=I0BRM8_9BACL|nr:anthranilate phosphoribosyltransferase [Paenibacillus mucilaginosus]AFH65025.1 anthranilate phosphoribosyltransferase [Paenibacillus mucilaginosus K02]